MYLKHLPLYLIYLRLVIGLFLIWLSFVSSAYFTFWAIPLLSIGLLSDILDGIIARKLNISTVQLRRLDSSIDQIFWCCVAFSVFIRYPQFFYDHAPELIILLLTEAITYVISYVRFKKEVATHAISSKAWTLLLFATLTELIWRGDSELLFTWCFYVGILTRLEIMSILILLPNWVNDVPSFYHALQLRKGKAIKRNKLFNG